MAAVTGPLGPATTSATAVQFVGATVNRHTLYLEVWETNINSTTNTSTINARLRENNGTTSSANNYSLETCTGSISIDGSAVSGAVTTKQYTNSVKGATITIATATKSINHTGKSSISVSAVFQFSDQAVAYKITTGTSVSGTYVLADTGYVSTPAPTAPTNLTASTNDSAGINLSWSGATGSITNYGIWYSGSSTGAPLTSSTPDFNTSSTSYTDTGPSQGGVRYYWVRSQGTGGNSAWYPAGGTGIYGLRAVPITTYTVNFTNTYGSLNSPTSSKTVNDGSTTTFPAVGSRSGYTFTGWNGNSSYYDQATTPAINSDTTFSADLGWTAITPGFTDETVTPQLVINQTIQSTANASVAASNTGTNPYSITYAGTGTFPSWLTINAATGALSGSTDVPGTYTFAVNALGANGAASVTSKVITITVVYPGKRINSTFGQSSFGTAKRWDGSQWVALTKMKRWTGSAWIDLTN
jgi:hypothetical protein